ncbi:tripartite tricarboxylate transporter substrate-binding protein [Bradyrhizobium sp. AZCC 1693]|uniref:tripartite tricarboxylate transporter substrate-binding protein n=1 Tax=Bradyrhizobium sp. AZCC 1693 TaxID=3117029 RepID=UPI002FF20466
MFSPGEIDLVVDTDAQAGRIRSLVFFSRTRAPKFTDVPTTEEATGHKWHEGVWRGFAAPKGLPKETAAQYETAIRKIWDSAEFKEFMNRRGLDMIYLDSAGFALLRCIQSTIGTMRLCCRLSGVECTSART